MADIFHYFPINVPIEKVFECVSTPKGLDIWWSKSSAGKPAIGETYGLFFGAEYNWEAVASKFVPAKEFELTMTKADSDWMNSKVGFTLTDKNNVTEVHFYHTGWKEDNEHYRISNYCWAMYLRILKRNLEFGEEVPYENRLNV
ncbi:MAG: SRPBCC domain-containing protein [Cyclobacteriaceae bacterium]|nr:SRPBCC domain-containing protein [Cyclobacteriaceae bacterium]